MIQPRNETEDLIFSIIKKCQTLIKQNHRRPEETLEFGNIKSREPLRFNPPRSIEASLMIGLIGLEVYNAIFNNTDYNI